MHLSVSKRRMKNKILFLPVFIFLFPQISLSQNNAGEASILFYNVENLFDIIDDPQTEDDNYTPKGELHWTSKRLNSKLLNISKVILGASGWNVPDIVALCEVENRYLLEKLLQDTPLKSIPYKIIHKESPDHRGIDVVALYNPETFYPLEYRYYPVMSKNNEIIPTREILNFTGILNRKDTIHLFVNHWPSRFSGLMETREQRKLAAALLGSKVDELNHRYNSPKIVILGDFNDNPTDESISEILHAKPIKENVDLKELYNLSYYWENEETGTLKYQSQWYFFDQIIVSGSLLNSTKGYKTSEQLAGKVNLPFLLERDERYGGLKPNRTYFGYSYKGGFSDHLPVLLRLISAN